MREENFIVIIFDNQDNAIEGYHKLQDLTLRGDISLGSHMMLKKGEDGKIQAMKKTSTEGKDTWTGMFVGMLSGLFLGPLGFFITTLTGTAIGAGFDYSKSNFEAGFLDKVKAQLENGKVAVVAQCDENDPAFIGNALKDYSHEIIRTLYSSEKED